MIRKNKLISIVLTTRNRKDAVLECINSLYQNDYPDFEVIIADNQSEDDTVAVVGSRFPKVKIVVADKNLGIAGGRNLGQKMATGEYILFLDSDTVVDKNFISELVAVMEKDTKVGMVVPKMYYYDNPDYLWFAGSTINLLTSRTINVGANEKDEGQYDVIAECAHGPTAFMVNRRVIKVVKGHDDYYFMTYADADFAVRTKKAGFKILYVPKAKLWHKISMEECSNTIRALGYNLPMRAYYFSRNRVIFEKKNAPFHYFVPFMMFIFPLFTLYYIIKIIQYKGKVLHIKNHLLGSWDGIKYAFNITQQNRITE